MGTRLKDPAASDRGFLESLTVAIKQIDAALKDRHVNPADMEVAMKARSELWGILKRNGYLMQPDYSLLLEDTFNRRMKKRDPIQP